MAKVLIIDDDTQVAGVLKAHLTEEGYEVFVAHTGAEGLAEARRGQMDLIMLDVMLPDATGFQLCKELRRSPATQSTPIIMMSGVARYPNQKVFGLERGANEYLLKPFQIVEVGDMVNSYIRPGHARSVASPAVHRTPPPPHDNSADSPELRSFIDKAMNRFQI